MKIVEDKLKEMWATDITYKTKDYITTVSYKLNGIKHKKTFDWWEVAIKIFPIKEKYQPFFLEHRKKTDELCLQLDKEFEPTVLKYQEEIKKASEAELLRQFEKVI